MKKYCKLFTVGILALCMSSAAATTAFAASDAEYTKNENVYVRLEQDGDVKGCYVVNTFNVTKEGEITDYGEYDKIQNLTNLDKIESDKNEQTFTAEEGKFSYQGDIDKAELPWSFDITYKLDGEEAEEKELSGAEGDLEILIKTRKNPAVTDRKFFEGYMLQISLNLDSKRCKNIKAKGATISDAGSNDNITFVVMPGTEANLLVSAEVKDFEMDDISINAVPAADMPVSYVSAKNAEMGKSSFIISADGVTIPEPEPEPIEEEEPGFLEKLINLIKGLFE